MLKSLTLLCIPALLCVMAVSAQAQGSGWCDGNLLSNGNFSTGLAPWNKGMHTVDYNPAPGCGGDAGFINMWGNMAQGEWIWQTLPSGGELKAGKTYEISFCQRFSPQAGRPYPVRFRIVATNDGTAPYTATTIALSDLTSSTTWTTATAVFQCPPGPDLSIIMVHAENESSATGAGTGDSTSTGQLDMVCIREVEPCQCEGTITPYKSPDMNCDCYYRFQLISPTETDSIVLRPTTPGGALECANIVDLPQGWTAGAGRAGDIVFHTGSLGRPLSACDTAIITFGVNGSTGISWASYHDGGGRPDCSGTDSVTCCDCNVKAYMMWYKVDTPAPCNYDVTITSPNPVDSIVISHVSGAPMGHQSSQTHIPTTWQFDAIPGPISYSGPPLDPCYDASISFTISGSGTYLVSSYFEGHVVCQEEIYLVCDSCETCELQADPLPAESQCDCGRTLRFTGNDLVGDIILRNYDNINITSVESDLISSRNWNVLGLGTPEVRLRSPDPYVYGMILPCEETEIDVCLNGSAMVTVETRYVHGKINWEICRDSVYINCEPTQVGDCLLRDPCFDNVHGTLDPHYGNPITSANLPDWISLHKSPDILPANSDWMGSQAPFCAEYYGGISSGMYNGSFTTEAIAGLMVQPTPATGHWVNVHARFVKGEKRPTPAVDLEIYLRNGSNSFTEGDASTYGLFVAKVSVTEYDDWQLYTKDMFVGAEYDQLMFIGDKFTKHNLGYVFIDSVNVCLIDPPVSSPCDSIQITGALIDGECCKYRVSITNSSTYPVDLISYHVVGGTIDMVNAQPCPYTAQTFGPSAGGMSFTGGCYGNMTFDIGVNAASNPGVVQLDLTLGIGGERCTYNFEFICEKDGGDCICCDIVETDPFDFTGLDLSGMQFQVHNLKDPPSPITHIDIHPDPTITGCILQGGGLEVDAIPQSWGLDYYRAPLSGSFPTPTAGTNTLITFNLGVDFTCGWNGSITLVIFHADGDSCVFTHNPWKTTRPVVSNAVTQEPYDGDIYSNMLRVTSASDSTHRILIWPELAEDKILAGSGQHLAGGDADRNAEIIADYRQADNLCLFEFQKPLKAGVPSGHFNITVKSAVEGRKPRLYWTSFDEQGIALETGFVILEKTSGIPPMGGTPLPGDFQLLPYFPDPATDNAMINFQLGQRMHVQLDIYTLLGEYVTTVFRGDREAGLQSVRFNTSRLASGNYYLRMSSGDRQTTQQLRIAH